jgi:tetratricopeptide (TPR) repeat protein
MSGSRLSLRQFLNLGDFSMRATFIRLLFVVELGCMAFSVWLVFGKNNFLLGGGLLVAAYFLSIILRRLIRYEANINAWKKAFKSGDLRKAQDILLEIMEIAAKFKSTDPRIAELWIVSGSTYLDNAEYADAERCFRRAIALREQRFGPDHFLVGECLCLLGRVQLCLAQVNDSERTFLRAQELLMRDPRPGHFYLPMVLTSLSGVRKFQGKTAEAERLAVEARDILETGPWREKSPMAGALCHLGEVYLKQGKLAEAESVLQQSLSVWRKATAAEIFLVGPLRGLAEVHLERKEFDRARALLNQAQAIMEKSEFVDHPFMAGIFHVQATLSAAKNDPVHAEVLYRRTLQIQEKVLGPEHPDVAEVLRDYASFLKKLGRDKEAAELSRGR